MNYLVYCGDIQRYFLTKKHITEKNHCSPIKKSLVVRFKLSILINTSLKSARGEDQSNSEFSGDTDTESKRFQFDRCTLTKVSQSTVEGTLQAIAGHPTVRHRGVGCMEAVVHIKISIRLVECRHVPILPGHYHFLPPPCCHQHCQSVRQPNSQTVSWILLTGVKELGKQGQF